ncbi:nucleotidyltransferase domain-containing protein [Streptosporangium sandarakinum]|uniref:nucleotidyltransferase domain-containing protein n=1 Tax=Streptosporangium sandarakinum TaxID=1260955 RepID=UPI003698595F
MAVSESERRNWTAPGAQDAAKRTYDSVKTALDRSAPLAGLDYEVFLQGSYANATNTRGDSDVDIVIMLKSIYIPDGTQLSPSDKVRFESRKRATPTMTAATFRNLVQQALINYYGAERVHPKAKCLRVDKRDGYVDADVVPALQHRRFLSYPAYGDPLFIEGIAITPLQGGRIINYPKRHRDNGQIKNTKCGDKYKPTVRQVKRLRRRAVELGLVGKSEAPGYLLECLVYNVPNHLFVADDSRRLSNAMAWLAQYTATELAAQCVSCDEVHRLFIDDPGEHNEYITEHVLKALWKLL